MGWGSVLGGVAGGFLGGPAGAAIGSGLGSALDGSMEQDAANRYNSAEAVSAYHRSREARQTAYQDTMGDMKAAGLNPMLAFSRGPTNMTGMAAASYPTGAGGAVVSSAASAKQADISAQQTEANVAKISQEIVNLQTENDKARALIENLRVEYQNLVKQGYNLTEVGNNLRATWSEIQSRIGVQNADMIYKQFENELMQYSVRAATQMDGLGQSAGQLKPFLDLIRSIVVRPR